MSVPDRGRVQSIGAEIIKALETHRYGCPNPEAVSEIERLADDAVRSSGADGYVSEKASRIKTFAAILYSARKHRNYDTGGFPNGAERVRSLAMSEARNLVRLCAMTQEQIQALPQKLGGAGLAGS